MQTTLDGGVFSSGAPVLVGAEMAQQMAAQQMGGSACNNSAPLAAAGGSAAAADVATHDVAAHDGGVGVMGAPVQVWEEMAAQMTVEPMGSSASNNSAPLAAAGGSAAAADAVAADVAFTLVLRLLCYYVYSIM